MKIQQREREMRELRLADMCGGVVAFEPINKEIGLKCRTCGKPAIYAIMPLGTNIERGLLVLTRWFYCGVCEEE